MNRSNMSRGNVGPSAYTMNRSHNIAHSPSSLSMNQGTISRNVSGLSLNSAGTRATKKQQGCPCMLKNVPCQETLHAAGEAKCKWDDEADSLYFNNSSSAVADYYNSPSLRRYGANAKKRSHSSPNTTPKKHKTHDAKKQPSPITKKESASSPPKSAKKTTASASPRSVPKINNTPLAPEAEPQKALITAEPIIFPEADMTDEYVPRDALSPVNESMPMSENAFGMPPEDHTEASLNKSIPMPMGDASSFIEDIELEEGPSADLLVPESPIEEEDSQPRWTSELLRATVEERRSRLSEIKRDAEVEEPINEEEMDAPEVYMDEEPKVAEVPDVPELEGTETVWDEDNNTSMEREVPEQGQRNYCCCLTCLLILLLLLIALVLFLFLYRDEYNCNIFQEQCCVEDHCSQARQCFGTDDYPNDYCVYSLSSCKDQCSDFE